MCGEHGEESYSGDRVVRRNAEIKCVHKKCSEQTVLGLQGDLLMEEEESGKRRREGRKKRRRRREG